MLHVSGVFFCCADVLVAWDGNEKKCRNVCISHDDDDDDDDDDVWKRKGIELE